MVRGKVQLKRIENTTSRQVTFTKRRTGLLKKAYELSVLCDADVGLIVFSQKGKLYEFASSNMQKTIERYREHVKKEENCNPKPKQPNHKAAVIIRQKFEQLEASTRKFLGQDTVSCSLDEIIELSGKLEHSLRTIRERKTNLYKEQIGNLKEKERSLLEENERLRQENTSLCQKYSTKQKDVVDTDLFIGLRLSQNARDL